MDAAFDKNCKELGLRVVIRNHAGELLQVMAKRVKVDSSGVAELVALQKAIHVRANQYGDFDVEIRMDAANSVVWLETNGKEDPWFVKPVLTDILWCCAGVATLKLGWCVKVLTWWLILLQKKL